MTTAAHPYSKVEPLLCSTRCQVVVEHETTLAFMQIKTFPIVMIMKILEYVSYSREEENALPKHDVITRWKVFAFTRDDGFLQRALATDLFRFATHGIKSTQDLGARFDFLNSRIDSLYPKEYTSYNERFPISPLDLARVATVTHPKSKFDPYKPLNWSKAIIGRANGKLTYNTDNNNEAFWQNLCRRHQNLTSTGYPQPYLPANGQHERVVLAPFRIDQISFCPIIVQVLLGPHAQALDYVHFADSVSNGSSNFSYLPIANAAVNPGSPHTVTYGLEHNSSYAKNEHNFTLRRMQAPPEPATAADAPKKKSECTIQ